MNDVPPARRDLWLMVGLVAAMAIVTIAFGERIGVNGGFGWDGSAYGSWALDYWRALDKGLTGFQAKRILPSGIIYYLLKAVGARHTVPNVIFAFQVYNAVLIVACAAAWWRIATLVGLSRRTAWVGFVALFGSFAILKHTLYYPTLTDTSAFALGTAMVWAFLARRSVTLFVLIALSALTWPPLPAFGGLLLVLRRPRQPPASSAPRWVPIAAIAAGVVAAVVVGLAMYHYVIDLPYPQQRWVDMIIRSVWPLTVALVLAYVGIGVYALARPPQTWRLLDYVRDVRWWYIVVTIVAMVVVYKVQGKIVGLIDKQGSGTTTGEHLALITIESLRGPLVHVVLGVVYYGPILLIAIVCWPRVAAVVASWGPGAVLAAVMAIVEALGTESRQIIHAVPFVVTATMVATQARWRSTPLVALFVVLTLAWSKIWLTIDYHKHFTPQLFPNQWFFMHHGPWASTTTYVVHGVCMVVTAIILLVAMRLWRPRPEAARSGPSPETRP